MRFPVTCAIGALILCVVIPTAVAAQTLSNPEQPAPARSADASVGKQVLVTNRDGSVVFGRLESFSATEVVIENHHNVVRLDLAKVRMVERVPHHARMGALIGAAVGGGLIVAAATSCGDCQEAVSAASIYALISVGAGAIVGAVANAMADRIVFEAPGHTSVSLIPLIAAKRAGIALTFSW
jgi:small nuclear ribonucleoprotein (snRNP)-like protein